jgi:hypothetical protein
MLALTILLPLAIAAAGTGTVFGQSCGLQVGSMAATTQNSQGYYYGQFNPYNIQLTVPISTSCTNMGAQLWATGTVFDTLTNANLGSNSAVMTSNNGYYAGQLTFTVPSSVVQHVLQVQIQVYNSYNNGQYAGLVASSSPTVTIHASSYYQPSSNYYTGYPSYYNGYPTGYYNGYYYYSNGNYYYYYPYYYYYYSSPYSSGSCYNGQTIVYYNGSYYYASCYWGHHHH